MSGMSALNKVRYQQFLKQARGVDASELQVRRVDKRGAVVLQYTARARKGGQRLNGEWSIERGERSDEDVRNDIKAFLDQARKDFFVKRGEGLGDEGFADSAMEAPVDPIVAEKKDD